MFGISSGAPVVAPVVSDTRPAYRRRRRGLGRGEAAAGQPPPWFRCVTVWCCVVLFEKKYIEIHVEIRLVLLCFRFNFQLNSNIVIFRFFPITVSNLFGQPVIVSVNLFGFDVHSNFEDRLKCPVRMKITIFPKRLAS